MCVSDKGCFFVIENQRVLLMNSKELPITKI